MPHMATKHVFCIAFKAFLDMVQGLLQKIPADLHFLLFTTTLQRGGTCAAHGIEAQNAILAAASFFDCPPWSDVNLDVSKDSVLEGSGLDFGSLGPRFWSLRASILEVPGLNCDSAKWFFRCFQKTTSARKKHFLSHPSA